MELSINRMLEEEFAEEAFQFYMTNPDGISWESLQQAKDRLGPERYQMLKRTRLRQTEATMDERSEGEDGVDNEDGTVGESVGEESVANHGGDEEMTNCEETVDDNSFIELKDDVEEARDDIKMLFKQLEMVKREVASLKSEQEKATADIQKLDQWRKNLLCAKSDNLSTLNATENRLEKSRDVLFLCPLCPGNFWHKMITMTVELHGNFWVHYDPSNCDLSRLDSTQYEFYPAVLDKNRAIARKSWRDTNEFKTIRGHLRFCYRSRHGSELDDDKTGCFDMWRPVQRIKMENRFNLKGRGIRCYTSDEAKTIVDKTAKEQVERERSRFLVQLKDTFDNNLMSRVAGEGYRPKKSIGDFMRENRKRKQEKMQQKTTSSVI